MIATSIKQSKKLLKIGIDPNTADMYRCPEMPEMVFMWEKDLS